MKTVALIPARSGSKGIPDKNIRPIAGKPMLLYSIEHALASNAVERVFVSTDSEVYRALALDYGAEAPFLRPKSISDDFSTDLEVFQHFLGWLQENSELPEYLVHLRPTHPVRNPNDIDRMFDILCTQPKADSIRSVSPAKQTPYKMWFFNNDEKTISPVVTSEIRDAYNVPRQMLPTAYMQNACIDITKTSTIIKKNSMTGDHVLGYKLHYDFDIDTMDELVKAELFLGLREKLHEGSSLKLCFDIDGIIAELTVDNNYALAKPLLENISIVNSAYDMGHDVTIFTARGSLTGIDWSDITERQMHEWGVKYHKLKYGKPAADIYIDDKNFYIGELKNILDTFKK